MSEMIKFACKKVMVEPAFFSDDEVEALNGIGENIMNEIFFYIPTIGLTQKEKEDYREKVLKLASQQVEVESISEEEKEVQEKKPRKKSENSSSN